VERLGAGGGYHGGVVPLLVLIVFRVVPAQRIERGVDHLHGKHAPLDLNHGSAVKGRTKSGGVDRGRGDHDLKVGSPVTKTAQMTEQEVDVQRSLVSLVDDHRVVLAEQRVALHFGEQHAVRQKFNHGGRRRAIVETHLAADLPPPSDTHFFCHATGNGQGGYPTRLGTGNAPPCAAPCREAKLGNLRRLPRARLSR